MIFVMVKFFGILGRMWEGKCRNVDGNVRMSNGILQNGGDMIFATAEFS